MPNDRDREQINKADAWWLMMYHEFGEPMPSSDKSTEPENEYEEAPPPP